MGDIIEIRPATMDPWSTPIERTKFYFLRVNGIPDAKYPRIRERLLEKETRGDKLAVPPTYERLRPRVRSLCGPDFRKNTALKAIANRLGPAYSANLYAYFDGETEQPEAEVLSISWSDFRGKLWDKKRRRLSSVGEMEQSTTTSSTTTTRRVDT